MLNIQFFLLVEFFLLTVEAQGFAAVAGASSVGLAGSGRSSVNSNESFLLNPATLAHLDGASLTLSSYFYQVPSILDNPIQAKAWRISMAENSPMNELPLALSFAQQKLSDSQQSDFWFSAGNFVSPYITAGIAYHYIDYRNTSDQTFKFVNNASLGFMFTPNPNLGFSLVFEDFLPDRSEITALKAGIGAIVLYDSFFRVHLDLLIDQNPKYQQFRQASLGLENMINEWILTRWGFGQTRFLPKNSEASLNENAFAFGLGFLGPKFEIYLSSKQNTGIRYSKEHGVDFHIPF
jgi:hypothetical protein